MKAPDVKPISSVGNFSVDEHGDKGITWNFRLSPDADSDISVTTGEPAKATIGANDMKDAAIHATRGSYGAGIGRFTGLREAVRAAIAEEARRSNDDQRFTRDHGNSSDRRCSIRKRSAQCRFILETVCEDPIADAQI